jgi:predicted nucleic acid-binding Zn ribbon protein
MKIVSREQIELNDADRKLLEKTRRKKTIFLLTAYSALIVILLLVFLTGGFKSSGGFSEIEEKHHRATVILTLTSFIVFTVVFIIHYIRAVYPYTRDLKNGLKTVSWFYPVGYKTPFFDHFFLKTGSTKKPMLAIPKYAYDAIQPGVLACIMFTPSSKFLLSLDINGFLVEYNEESGGMEL